MHLLNETSVALQLHNKGKVMALQPNNSMANKATKIPMPHSTNSKATKILTPRTIPMHPRALRESAV